MRRREPGGESCNAVTGTLAAPAAGGYADPYQAQLANATLPNGSPAIPTIASAAAGGCQGASIGIGASIGPATAGGTIYYSQVRDHLECDAQAGVYLHLPQRQLLDQRLQHHHFHDGAVPAPRQRLRDALFVVPQRQHDEPFVAATA